jgi:hypothetical protein
MMTRSRADDMPAPVPEWLTFAFIVLVLAMATLVMLAVALRRGGGAAAITALAVDGWLVVTAVAGGRRSLHGLLPYSPRAWWSRWRRPPRHHLALRSAAVGRLLDEIPPPGWSTRRPSGS